MKKVDRDWKVQKIKTKQLKHLLLSFLSNYFISIKKLRLRIKFCQVFFGVFSLYAKRWLKKGLFGKFFPSKKPTFFLDPKKIMKNRVMRNLWFLETNLAIFTLLVYFFRPRSLTKINDQWLNSLSLMLPKKQTSS